MKLKTAFLIFAAVLNIALFVIISKSVWQHMRQTHYKIKWDKERRLAEEKIRSRQLANETDSAVTIDLKPYINLDLTNSPAPPKWRKDDNLAELPLGKHIYAGVPFDVQGLIQLSGRGMLEYGKNYPEKVDNIYIGQSCKNIYLLHAAHWIYPSTFGNVVAKIVIHYIDGSTNEFDLVSGKQEFDWWCPLMTNGVEEWKQMAPDTEMAWSGSNPDIRQEVPDYSLVLFKTTLDNPQPQKVVSSLDYVSTLTGSAPFLVGLTVE